MNFSEIFKKSFLDGYASTDINIICIFEVVDISPGNLDSSLCFIQLSISDAVLCM